MMWLSKMSQKSKFSSWDKLKESQNSLFSVVFFCSFLCLFFGLLLFLFVYLIVVAIFSFCFQDCITQSVKSENQNNFFIINSNVLIYRLIYIFCTCAAWWPTFSHSVPHILHAHLSLLSNLIMNLGALLPT